MLNLIYYVELFWLSVDTVSGFFQNNGVLFAGQTIAAIFRIFVFVLLVVIVIKYSHRNSKLPHILLFYVAFLIPIHALLYSMDLTQIIINFQYQLKILMSLLLYSVFLIQMKASSISTSQIKKIITLNAIILLINLYLGILGIGFGSYGEDPLGEQLGSKGFFYSGNEVAVSLVAIYALIIYLYRDIFKTYIFRLMMVMFLFFIGAISLLSKTAMLGFVLVTGFAIYHFLSRVKKIQISAIFAVFLLLTAGFWMPILNIAIDRWLFHYDINSDLLYFITSGRSDRMIDLETIIFEAPTQFSLIFGYGWIAEQGKFSFENDLLDSLGVFGPIGIIFTLIWVFWMFLGFKKYKKDRKIDGSFSAYCMFILILISLLAGHVLMSVMTAPFVALIGLVASRYFPKSRQNINND